MFLCQKVEKSVQFNSLFLRIPKMLLCVRIGQIAFRFEDWKRLSVWSSVLFTVSALTMHEMEAYKKTGEIKCVCPSRPGLRLRAWLIYAGVTENYLNIICKHFSLSYKHL